MSLPVIVWVFQHSTAKLGARLTLLALAEFAHDDGSKAFPTIKTLTERTLLSERAVRDALRRLEADRLIVRTGETSGGVNIYRVLMGANSAGAGGRMTPNRGADSAPNPTTGPVTEETTSPPKLVKIDGKNLGFDALAEECGIDPRNKTRVRELTAALKDIRAYVAEESAESGEPFERHLASEIRRRASLYRRRMPRAALTPPALAKWWHDVDRPARRGSTDLSDIDVDDL